jgi:histidine triad (HIT) family protein
LFDLDEATLNDLMRLSRKVSFAIKKSVPCKRIGIAVIGLEVPHAHIHLVPLNTVNDINFTQPKLQPTQQALEAMARLIRSNL